MRDEVLSLLPAVALHQLWLGALIVAIAWLAVQGVRVWTASARYWLWCAVLAVIALLPLFMVMPGVAKLSGLASSEPQSVAAQTTRSMVRSAREPSVAPATSRATAVAARIPTPRVEPSLAALLLFAWLVGVACKLSNVARALAIPRRWRRAAIAVRIDSGGTCEVLESSDVRTPMVVGVLRPCILLPVGLREQLTAEELAFVVAHEHAHIRRGDPAVALIQRVIAALYFYNPAVHWVARHIERERECSCDDIAVGGVEQSERYAKSLLAVARHVVEASVPHAAIGAIGQPSQLGHRIERLLGDRARDSWRSRLAACGTAAAVLVTATLLSPAIPIAHAGNAQTQTDDWPPMTWSRARPPSALLQAVEDGDIESVRALVKSGANVSAPVIGDGTPLIVAARRGNEQMVATLLELGADVNVSSRGDGNPLIGAAAGGNLEIVKLLVDHGADVNAYVPGDETPLINAARTGNREIVDYLIAHGANVHLEVPAEDWPGSEVRSPLGEARKHGRTAVIKRLIEVEAQQAGGR